MTKFTPIKGEDLHGKYVLDVDTTNMLVSAEIDYVEDVVDWVL